MGACPKPNLDLGRAVRVVDCGPFVWLHHLGILGWTSSGDPACHRAGGKRGSERGRNREAQGLSLWRTAEPWAERDGGQSLLSGESLVDSVPLKSPPRREGKKSGFGLGIPWGQAMNSTGEMLG